MASIGPMKRLIRASAILIVAGCAAILAACGEDEPVAVESPANPLLIFGIDGATWRVIDPMIENGELPNLAALRERGVHGDLMTVGPMVSPVVWTTFATGRFGRAHGILDFVYPYTPGPKKPVRSTQRQVPAIWNIASAAGRRVGVAGYFVSYPAERVNGINISERAFQGLEGSTYPEDLLDPYSDRIGELHSDAGRKAVWQRFFPWPHDPDGATPDDPAEQEASRLVGGPLDRNLVYSEFLRRSSNAVLDDQAPFDVFIAYYRPVDVASHALWKYYDDSDYDEPADPAVKSLLGEVIPETYRYMDQILGELLERMPENTNVLVVSDHGFGSATGQYSVKPERADELTGNHRPDGIFLAAGPDIAPGRVEGLTVMEIMPLAMSLSGLPVADTLPGKLDYRPLAEGLFDRVPLTTVKAYSNESIARASVDAGAEEDAEVVKSLQGLGYVNPDFQLGERQGEEVYDFWKAKRNLVVSHLSGEMAYYLVRGDLEQAMAIAELAAGHDRELVQPASHRAVVAYRNLRRFAPQGVLDPDLAKRFEERLEASGLLATGKP